MSSPQDQVINWQTITDKVLIIDRPYDGFQTLINGVPGFTNQALQQLQQLESQQQQIQQLESQQLDPGPSSPHLRGLHSGTPNHSNNTLSVHQQQLQQLRQQKNALLQQPGLNASTVLSYFVGHGYKIATFGQSRAADVWTLVKE